MYLYIGHTISPAQVQMMEELVVVLRYLCDARTPIYDSCQLAGLSPVSVLVLVARNFEESWVRSSESSYYPAACGGNT